MLWNPMSALRVCDREAVFLRAAHTRTLPPADIPADTANFHIPHTSSFSVPCRCKWESRRRDKWRRGWRKRRRERKRRAAQHRLSHKLLWRSTRRPFTGNFLWRVFGKAFVVWCVNDVFVDCQTPLVPPAGAALWEMRAIHSELGVRDLGQLRCGYRELCAKPGERRQGFLQWGPRFGQSGKNHPLNWSFCCCTTA